MIVVKDKNLERTRPTRKWRQLSYLSAFSVL